MKVIVTEIPKTPIECVFASYDAKYDVCECILSYNGGFECMSTKHCPYLVAINKEEESKND